MVAKCDGPRLAGPRAAGPRVAGPRLAGPRAAGPRVAGPRLAGPRAAGPRVAVGGPAGPRPAQASWFCTSPLQSSCTSMHHAIKVVTHVLSLNSLSRITGQKSWIGHFITQKKNWSAAVTLECSSPKFYQPLTSGGAESIYDHGRHRDQASRILIQTPWNWPATSSVNFGLRTPATDNMRYLYQMPNAIPHEMAPGSNWLVLFRGCSSIYPFFHHSSVNSKNQRPQLSATSFQQPALSFKKQKNPSQKTAPAALLKGLVGKVCCIESLTISLPVSPSRPIRFTTGFGTNDYRVILMNY